MELNLFNSKKNSMNMTVLPFIDSDCFHVKCNSLVSTNSSDLSRWLSLLLFASVHVSCTTDVSLSLLFPDTTLTDVITLRGYPRVVVSHSVKDKQLGTKDQDNRRIVPVLRGFLQSGAVGNFTEISQPLN